MNEADAIELLTAATWQVIIVSAPLVLPAMFVGIVVALMQALTQVQEQTLTFVPKMVVVFITGLMTASFIGAQFSTMAENLFHRVSTGF
jgi:flagellar biosynthesis protein FliQ